MLNTWLHNLKQSYNFDFTLANCFSIFSFRPFSCGFARFAKYCWRKWMYLTNKSIFLWQRKSLNTFLSDWIIFLLYNGNGIRLPVGNNCGTERVKYLCGFRFVLGPSYFQDQGKGSWMQIGTVLRMSFCIFLLKTKKIWNFLYLIWLQLRIGHKWLSRHRVGIPVRF